MTRIIGATAKYITAAAFIGLAACSDAPITEVAVTTTPPPAAPVTSPPPESRETGFSQRSQDLALYYQRLQNDLTSRGLLRTDGGGPDTPFTSTMLARNFEQIALYDEYVSENDQLRAQTTESRLRRWEIPVRFGVEFGARVPADQRAEDRASVQNYVGRLARATGHQISYDEANPNFHVLILTEDDRLESADRLRQLIPGITEGSIRAFQTQSRGTLCLVLAFSQGNSASYTRAVALIRAEHPDLLRLSCVHEELAQGLGLANDSPAARPSIFNDDEEFALLTTQDELMLRILYDRRLRPGMLAPEAAPIVRTIANELKGSSS
ncbi:DUF2927 domain-containing protein [Pelagovum pacificum]|uniref:DUF2927 domain-containing protein n=1 Tax=Pelagovum pacificum TaxID=2588711 RepID=A0A5C5GEN6_9RHOB|nr:DUF2927 domain-containing protein [Pelagovum pacificum]QQA43667.1 DUF2927 domain-containing protein [Pelagovum pacificum]TNY33198.1 DUF2927 domain-containing protein [Pelagovum pacificum]